MISRNKPGVAFRATVVVVVVLVAYPLSFGPACWWLASDRPAGWASSGIATRLTGGRDRYARNIYWPIGWLAKHGPDWCGDAVFWYATQNGDIRLPTTSTGHPYYDKSDHLLKGLSRLLRHY